MRNRINLSRGNYKKPYIKQPEYEPTGLAESRTAEKREKKRKTESQRKEEETSGIRETEMERSERIEEDENASEGETRDP